MFNILKTTATITAIGLFTVTSVFAQTTATPVPPVQAKQQREENRIQMMKQRLAITDDQAARIADVLKDEHQTIKADRQAVQNAPADQKPLARVQMHQDMLVAKAKVLNMLTPEQRAKAEELHKERMSKVKKHWMKRGRK